MLDALWVATTSTRGKIEDVPATNLHLILGAEEFLAERAQHQIIGNIVQSAGQQVPVTTLRAGEVTDGELLELLSPSLFAEERVVVLTHAHEAGEAAAQLLLRSAVDLPPGITLVIRHSGEGRQKKMATKLAKIATVHRADTVSRNKLPAFVTNEFRSYGVRPTPDVVTALLEGVGSDLRELASAVSQLVADTDGNVTLSAVRTYHAGVAEVSQFDIADLACAGRVESAVASTRRALQLGMAPVRISSALANAVSAIAKLYSVRGAINGQQLAPVVGLPPWKVEKTAALARRWRGSNVSRAVIVVAELDAAVKGEGLEPYYAVESAVRRIAELAR